jgi:hypothetical protein
MRDVVGNVANLSNLYVEGSMGRCQHKQHIIKDMPRHARLDARGILRHVLTLELELLIDSTLSYNPYSQS